MGLAGILGSGLSLVRSRACRPCRCSKATALRYCCTGVGTTSGVEIATVVTGWYPVSRLCSSADSKADDVPDSWVLDESLRLDRLATKSFGRGATATFADAIDDEMYYRPLSSSCRRRRRQPRAWSRMGKVEKERLVSLSIVFRHFPRLSVF